jgi:hypothetical protein
MAFVMPDPLVTAAMNTLFGTLRYGGIADEPPKVTNLNDFFLESLL